jgi:hypothetical protein
MFAQFAAPFGHTHTGRSRRIVDLTDAVVLAIVDARIVRAVVFVTIDAGKLECTVADGRVADLDALAAIVAPEVVAGRDGRGGCGAAAWNLRRIEPLVSLVSSFFSTNYLVADSASDTSPCRTDRPHTGSDTRTS